MIRREPSSYVDPNGYVFRTDDGIYRAITAARAAFYRDFIEHGAAGRLVERGLLVKTAVSDFTHPDIPERLILQHQEVWPLTYCVEWCGPMLRDAAALTIELAQSVLEDGYMLQDAYPWNVLFNGSNPIHVDFTSIVPLSNEMIWPAYSQLQSFFIRPLHLSSIGKGDVARALLFDSVHGITIYKMLTNLSLMYKVRHPTFPIGAAVESWISARPKLKDKIKDLSKPSIDPQVRRQFFRGLRRNIDNFRLTKGYDPWKRYYQEIPDWVNRDFKVKIIRETLDRFKPQTVLDLGCNAGLFSILAAEAGARVLAADISEPCIAGLYETSRARKLRITPVICNALTPTPAFGFMASQFPSFIERASCDLVLCLALMHHLHIAGRQPLGEIARMLAKLSKRHLVFEFVASDDANNKRIGSGRQISYSLDSVADALRIYFPKIEMIASDRPTRSLLICEK